MEESDNSMNVNVLSRHSCFPDPRSPAILTTPIRQLTLTVIPSTRAAYRRSHVLPLLRRAGPTIFSFSSLQVRTSFDESRETIVLPDIVAQSEFLDSAFASAEDVARVAR